MDISQYCVSVCVLCHGGGGRQQGTMEPFCHGQFVIGREPLSLSLSHSCVSLLLDEEAAVQAEAIAVAAAAQGKRIQYSCIDGHHDSAFLEPRLIFTGLTESGQPRLTGPRWSSPLESRTLLQLCSSTACIYLCPSIARQTKTHSLARRRSF